MSVIARITCLEFGPQSGYARAIMIPVEKVEAIRALSRAPDMIAGLAGKAAFMT
jgi:hypothetical protein